MTSSVPSSDYQISHPRPIHYRPPTPPAILAMVSQAADEIAPFVVELFNRSLASSLFPASFKEAFITPVRTKAGLDVADVRSYRPISNLPVLSKLLERFVVLQLMDYLTSANLLPQLQSGFRPCHSTVTAVLKIYPIFFRPSTEVIWLFWSSWTCQLHSTRWITTSFCNACR